MKWQSTAGHPATGGHDPTPTSILLDDRGKALGLVSQQYKKPGTYVWQTSNDFQRRANGYKYPCSTAGEAKWKLEYWCCRVLGVDPPPLPTITVRGEIDPPLSCTLEFRDAVKISPVPLTRPDPGGENPKRKGRVLVSMLGQYCLAAGVPLPTLMKARSIFHLPLEQLFPGIDLLRLLQLLNRINFDEAYSMPAKTTARPIMMLRKGFRYLGIDADIVVPMLRPDLARRRRRRRTV